MKNMLASAIAFASDKHKDQFDKAGMPYILHPLTVMSFLDTDDLELMCIGVLHDVIEDCGVTFADLYAIGMSERVVFGVKGMTKVSGESISEQFARLVQNIDIIKTKLADLRHNMDPRRMKGVSPKDQARNDAYSKLYWMLKELV
jgi:(p)ppGpp synthase/HD superfamily hydrolase